MNNTEINVVFWTRSTLKTLDFTIHIGSTPTILYFDLWMNNIVGLTIVWQLLLTNKNKVVQALFKQQPIEMNDAGRI